MLYDTLSLLETNTFTMHYEAKTFEIKDLEGISGRTIQEHLGLYAGYVKHVNLIQEKITEMKEDSIKNAYPLAEVQRRLGFEFGGMKNHEAYFEQFVGGAHDLPAGALSALIETQWGTFEDFLAQAKATALTRGIGWMMVYYDKSTNQLVMTWVDEQHIGQLADVHIVLALDMWEHSYMLDYAPSEKKHYVEAFFKNLNWEVVAGRV
jgi:Fe-Mn family superoxide dismutase